MTAGKVYQVKIVDPDEEVSGKTLQVTPLNEGSGLLEFKLTGDSGTFTDDEIALIKSLNTALIFINDGQCFRLANMAEDLGYRTYVNVDCALSSSPVVQAIYVQLDPTSQNYKKWTKEIVE